MRDRVTVQTRTTSPNAFGEATAEWSALAVRWASVEPLSGNEYWRAQQTQAGVTHRVTLRYLDGLSGLCRLVLEDGRTLEVQSVVNPDGNRRYHEALCMERVV